jgi:hypothetical protein
MYGLKMAIKIKKLAPSKAVNCLACCILGQPVSTWQVEMGWPDIHWLAWDKGGLLVAAVLNLA